MSLWTDLYNRIFGTSTSTITSNKTKRTRTSPSKKNLTFPDTINQKLTRGLWHNSVEGFKLGGSLCFNPISVPIAFMGLSHFDIENQEKVNNLDFWIEKFKFYNEKYISEKKNIHLLCHRDGTIIIWPWFDAKAGFVRWKYIKPEDIYKVIVDLETEDLKALITRVRVCYYSSENSYSKFYDEQITYTEFKIIIKRTGDVPPEMRLEEIRNNPIKQLPIFFANNREPGELEGHSDYERIIPFIKAYSEVNKSAHETLINMSPKLIQYTNDVDKWLENNAYKSLEDVSIDTVDFIINLTEEEKSEFEIPEKIIDGHQQMMKLDFKNVVETSAIPEIIWGVKTEGNHASAKEQMGVFLSFIDDKQRQATTSYLELNKATMMLESIANTQQELEGLIITWNDLDALSEVERSEIFKNYSDGLHKLIDGDIIDLESAHKILFKLTNGLITTDFKKFKEGIIEYGTIRSFLDQEYFDIRTGKEEQEKSNKAKSEKHSNGVKRKKELINDPV